MTSFGELGEWKVKMKKTKWIPVALSPLVLALSSVVFAQTTMTAAVDIAVKEES